MPNHIILVAVAAATLVQRGDGYILRGIAVADPPFILYDPTSISLSLVYTGFCDDLLAYIVDRANRVYPSFQNNTITLPNYAAAAVYGTQNADGSWTGAVGAVTTGSADVGVGVFTLTTARVTSGVKFSTPFLSTGLAVLTRNQIIPVTQWRFVLPFTGGTWAAFLFAIVAACVSSWALDILSPYGFRAMAHGTHEKRSLNLPNALYNGAMVLLRKGTGPASACSTRTAFLAMFFVAYFMLRSYTATLTSIVTVNTFAPAVSAWTDIRDSRSMLFGVLNASSNADYFRNSDDPAVRAMASRMLLYSTTDAALADLRANVIVAVIAELPQLQYAALAPPCDLAIAGGLINSEYLGFIMNGTSGTFPPGALERVVNEGVQAAVEDGTIEGLYSSYLSYPGACDISGGAGTTSKSTGGLKAGDMAGIAYIFILLTGVAIVVLLVERCIFANRKAGPFARKLNKALGHIYSDSRRHRLSLDASENTLLPHSVRAIVKSGASSGKLSVNEQPAAAPARQGPRTTWL